MGAVVPRAGRLRWLFGLASITVVRRRGRADMPKGRQMSSQFQLLGERRPALLFSPSFGAFNDNVFQDRLDHPGHFRWAAGQLTDIDGKTGDASSRPFHPLSFFPRPAARSPTSSRNSAVARAVKVGRNSASCCWRPGGFPHQQPGASAGALFLMGTRPLRPGEIFLPAATHSKPERTGRR